MNKAEYDIKSYAYPRDRYSPWSQSETATYFEINNEFFRLISKKMSVTNDICNY